MDKKKIKTKAENLINLHGKIPPQAVDFEEFILGCVMDYEDNFSILKKHLTANMFYKEIHSILFEAMDHLFNNNVPIDILTISEHLKSTDNLEKIGGPYAITMISDKAKNTEINYHCLIIKQKYLLREVIRISDEATKNAYEESSDIFLLLEGVIREFDKLYDIIQQSKTINSKDIFSSIISDVTSKKITKEYRILTTGDDDFDKKMILQTNQQLLLAAKSGAGKTSFLIWYIKSLLERYSDILSINWYCMEDSLDDMILHMLSGDILKSNAQIKARELNDEEKEILMQRKLDYDKYDIEFHDQPTSIDAIYSSHMSFCKRRPTRFNILVVDNVMTLTDNDNMNQTKADDYISRKLMRTRKNTSAVSDSAIIVLHHYNDDQLKKENLKIAYRPNEKDIRGSTRYRDSSTIVMLMNNPENYKDLLDEYKNDMELLKALMLFEISKNRLGKLSSMRAFKSLEYKLFKFTNDE